ncbi:MAG: DUF5657 family protein [Candidatus Dojkabacteria bacterium]
MPLNFNSSVVDLIRLAAIIFALFHLLSGFILVRQMLRMNNIIKTPNKGFLNFVSLVYLIVLASVLIFIIILPLQ